MITVTVSAMSAGIMTLDITVVNVALEAIGREFEASLSALQWVVNGYALAFAALLMSAGSLSDRLGRRGIFVLGMAVFTLASLSCAISPSETVLIASRIVQGAGAALVLGTGLALISGAYEGEDPRRRQMAIGVITGVGAAASALGPLVGGALVDGAGWRFIFIINIPLGIFVILATLVGVHPQPRTAGTKLDLSGAALAAAVLFSLNYGLLTGAGEDWSRTDVLLTLGLTPVLLLAFLLLEHRRGSAAMLDLSLFRIPTFTGAIAMSFAARVTSFGLFPFLILWMSGLLGLTPLQIGYRLLVMSLAMIPIAPIAGVFTRWVPVRVLMFAGSVIVGVGLIWSALLIDATSDWTALFPALLLMGVGAGLIMPHMMGLAVGVVPAERAGMASGAANAFFPVGTTVGVAVFGAVTSAAISAKVSDPVAAEAVAAGRVDQVAAMMPPGAAAQFTATARDAFVNGLTTSMLIAGITSIVAGLGALFLIRAKDMRTATIVPEPEAEPEPAAV
jgi:EmrB/QacA subfamily drug resistance transporter